MKILAVNKFYYRKGGSEAYFLGLNDLLEENNIEVIPFSMKDKKNIPSKYEKYFIENIDYSNMNLKTKLINSMKMIYSFEAEKKIKRIVKDTKPQIAHLHIFQHQLSPSIIHGLKKYNVKVVNTVHDLKVICPNYKMLNKNGNCEECKGGKYYRCLSNSCVKGSKVNSAVSVVEAYVNKFIKSYSYVDKFICPSKFYRDKFIEFGIPKEKVIYIPNFIDLNDFKPNYEHKGYFVYVGRLSEEKGVKTLIEAMKSIKEIKLRIVGTGPLEEELKQLKESLNLDNVEFLGFKTGDELKMIVSNAMFAVVPSEWYENCPMTVIESMAYGKAVLGSDSGGIPELIRNNETGLIFKTGDKEDLVNKINCLVKNPEKTIKMGINGRKVAENEYNKDIHFERIKKVYDELLENRR